MSAAAPTSRDRARDATRDGAPPALLTNIQLLRAVAAMAVVVVHAKTILPGAMLEGWAGRAVSVGHAGVDVFFVISGFIMVHVTRPDTTPARFIGNRIVRIVPFYYLVTFATFALALVAPSLMQATEADPVHLAKSLAFVPFEKANGLIQPTVFVGWTINYEMMFYAVFALALLARGRTVRIVTAVLAVLVLLGPHVSGVPATFYSNPIVLEFVAGMAIARAMHRLCPPGVAAGLVAAGIAAIVLSPWIWPHDLHRALRFGIPAAAIVYGALSLERAGWRFDGARLLGDASFSIYLTHFYVTQAVAKVARAVEAGPALSVALFGLALVGAALFGIVVHRLVEMPLLRASRALRDAVAGRRREPRAARPGRIW